MGGVREYHTQKETSSYLGEESPGDAGGREGCEQHTVDLGSVVCPEYLCRVRARTTEGMRMGEERRSRNRKSGEASHRIANCATLELSFSDPVPRDRLKAPRTRNKVLQMALV